MTTWQRSRLIPTGGIGSEKEAEVRATSALLAVLSIVRPLSHALLDPLGASKAQSAVVDTFVEIPFKSATKSSRPDGLIRVQHGKKDPWVALIEVKTGESTLNADQVNDYWEIARENDFDAVITISNEMSPGPGVHPVEGLKVRANSKVKVHHWSWFSILTAAAVERDHRGVDDPEQSWILNELIRYLEHPNSGAGKFGDMGEHWTAVRDAAKDGTLNKRTTGLSDIVSRWDQLMRYMSLRLSSETGASVQPVMTKAHRESNTKRASDLADGLCSNGTLQGSVRIPNAVGDVDITADLRGQRITITTVVEAPKDRGTKARVTWLLRQLTDAPDDLIVEVWPRNGRHAAAIETLGNAREEPRRLAPDELSELAKFRLVSLSDMGKNRRCGGRSPSFVEAIETATFAMYEGSLQSVRPWTPSAPRIDRPVSPSAAAEIPLETEDIAALDDVPVQEPGLTMQSPPVATPQWWVAGPSDQPSSEEREEGSSS